MDDDDDDNDYNACSHVVASNTRLTSSDHLIMYM